MNRGPVRDASKLDMKRCSQCGELKPLVQFHRQNTIDGYRTNCKACVIEQNRLWRERNPELSRGQDKRWRERHKEYKQYLNAKYQRENREKIRANAAVRQAIANGRLVKPETCPECNGTPVYGHHDDYDKPLEVRWLCARCHRRLHAGLLVDAYSSNPHGKRGEA